MSISSGDDPKAFLAVPCGLCGADVGARCVSFVPDLPFDEYTAHSTRWQAAAKAKRAEATGTAVLHKHLPTRLDLLLANLDGLSAEFRRRGDEHGDGVIRDAISALRAQRELSQQHEELKRRIRALCGT